MDSDCLRQGDVLLRTPALAASIGQAHQYYAEASDYSHFIVLTQSCDLVRRNEQPPSSRYITIAAARPLRLALQRFVEKFAEKDAGSSVKICDAKIEGAAKQFLERLMHNTADHYFFIRKGSVTSVEEDLCVFLRLSIALRSSEHYDACLAAKVGQMQDIFAAKLGWLAGNLYSRVGTPDIDDHVQDPAEYKERFLTEAIEGSSIYWLGKKQIGELKSRVRAWRKANQDAAPTREVVEQEVRALPTEVELLARAVIDHLQRKQLLRDDNDAVARAQQALVNFPTFVSMSRSR